MSITPQDWNWRGVDRLVHQISKRITENHYTMNTVDYVTGCGVTLSVDNVQRATRTQSKVTCLRCAVAGINQPVIDGE